MQQKQSASESGDWPERSFDKNRQWFCEQGSAVHPTGLESIVRQLATFLHDNTAEVARHKYLDYHADEIRNGEHEFGQICRVGHRQLKGARTQYQSARTELEEQRRR